MRSRRRGRERRGKQGYKWSGSTFREAGNRMKKQIIAAMMALCVGFTSLPPGPAVYGAGIESVVTDGEGAITEETENTESTEETEHTEDKGNTQEAEQSDASEVPIHYMMVESDYVDLPGTQNIVVGIGQEDTLLTDLRLSVRKRETGEVREIPVSAKEQDLALFSMDFKEPSDAGIYEAAEIAYTYEGKEYRQDLRALEMEVLFGVHKTVETNPDDLLVDEEVLAEIEANVVQMDENGKVVSENSIGDVVSQGIADGLDVENNMRRAGNLVVVLDAGHDDTHAGASANGAREEQLTLKIAQYCRDELNTYGGVTVYMVRDSGTCPYSSSGWISSGTCNERRVAFAAGVGANIYVSFHLNASASSNVNGVGVYYPNTSYRPDLSDSGKQLAQKVYEKLRALGLTSWAGGLLTQNSSDYKYDDGSVADYLAVIRNCKKAGIPAILIEHAFLTGTYDYNTFLNSDEKLRALGVADATAIAERYGLRKGNNTANVKTIASVSGGKIRVEWDPVENGAKYEIHRSTKPETDFEKIDTVSKALYYEDSDVTKGKTYYYSVRVILNDGSPGEYSRPLPGVALGKANLASAASVGSKKMKVRWDTVKGAAGYYLYRSSDGGKFSQIASVSGGTATEYVDTVSKNNTVYDYKVQAYNQGINKTGVGSVSEIVSGKTVAVPSGITLSIVDDSAITLSWKKVSGAEFYEIYRSTSENGSYKKIETTASGKVTSYTDDSIKAGKTYFYKIQAVNEYEGQTGYSGLSAVYAGKTVARSNVTYVKSVNSTTLEIGWEKIPDAYGYRLKRSASKNGSYKVIKTFTSKDTVSYQDKKKKEGKTYYYKVETLSKIGSTIGYSGDSAAVGGKTAEKTEILHVAPNEDGALEIAWEEVENAWGYRIKRSTSKNGSYKVLKTLSGEDETEYTDGSVSYDTQYYYKVETINKNGKKKGYSGDCTAVAGKLLKKTSISSMSAVDSSTIRLNWKKVSGVSGYYVLRSTKKNGDYESIAKVKGSNSLKYEDKTVKAGKNYYYKIQTYKKCQDTTGVSEPSVSKKAWTVAPVDISKVSGSENGNITLKWNSVKNADSYVVYRKEGTSGKFKKVKEVDADKKLQYIDSDTAKGKVYSYKIAANTILTGTKEGRGDFGKTVKVPALAKAGAVTGQLSANDAFSLSWGSVENATGYELACSLDEDDNYVTLTKTAANTYVQQNLQPGATYYYKVRAYASVGAGSTVYGSWSNVAPQTAGHMIMGQSNVTTAQMLAYYTKAGYSYPSGVYASRGAATAEDFFNILREEAQAEGVRADLLFAQVILETGGLSFGGDVSVEQCNFGGIGATGNGAAGIFFPDVRTGLRAQVQHLKAYACKDPLNQACVDPRFSLVSRGCAPYIEWLAIPKNPTGAGWAADPDYGTKLLNIIKKL